jgi:membrane protein insertase Oxa1/YidC/SpoIIIJ
MYFINLSIFDWPIIKQFSDLMGEIMRMIYLLLSSFGAHSAILCLVFFVFASKIFMLPLSIDAQRGAAIKKFSAPKIEKLKERYSDMPNTYNRKLKTEMKLINDKYYGSRFNGGIVFFVNFSCSVALYGVVTNLEKYIPELSSTALDELYNFLSLDLRLAPKEAMSYSLLVPVFVYLTSLVNGFFTNHVHRTPIFSVASFVSPLTIAFFAFTFPMFVGVYWGLRSIVDVFVGFFIYLYYKNKPEEYFLNLALKKHNNKRKKRGLPPLNNVPAIEIE